MSSVDHFKKLFVEDDYSPFPGADTFNEPINWDTGMCSLNRPCIHPQELHTESKKRLGSATNMNAMFLGLTVFNQQLALDTSKVTDVRLYNCLEPNRNEKPDSDFLFPIQLIIRWAPCSRAQLPSINYYLLILPRLQM